MEQKRSRMEPDQMTHLHAESEISLIWKDFQHPEHIGSEDPCCENLKSTKHDKEFERVGSICKEDYLDNGITISRNSDSHNAESNLPKNSIEIHSNTSHPDALTINIGQVDSFRQIKVDNQVTTNALCKDETQNDTTIHISKESLCVQCCILIGSVSLGSWYYNSCLVTEACALFKDMGVTKTFAEAFRKACLSNSLMFSTMVLLMLLFIVIIVCPIMLFNRRTRSRR